MLHNMVQKDASINPRNSGGRLLDSRGRLIGMNTLIFSRTGSSAGIGFAVPANDIKRVVDQIIQYGKVKQPAIGVQIFNQEISDYLGIKGVVVSTIVANTPAAKTGLRGTYRDENREIHLGDNIVQINGHPVNTYVDLFQILDNVHIGDTVNLQYKRDDKLNDVELTTVEMP